MRLLMLLAKCCKEGYSSVSIANAIEMVAVCKFFLIFLDPCERHFRHFHLLGRLTQQAQINPYNVQSQSESWS